MFFLGPNDFYNGLSWDGVKLNATVGERLWFDLLGLKMAELNPGDPDIYLTGIYANYDVYKEGSLQGYLLYHEGGFPFQHREFEIIDSDQEFFNLGVRFAGNVGRFDYELEPGFQWGKVKNAMGDGRDDVRAYGGHLDIGYTLALPWEPRVFAAYALGSGDNDPFDGEFAEFHGNIFNDNYLVGDTSVIPDLSGVTVEGIRASGMQVWVSGVSVTPLPDLCLSADAHFFRAGEVPSWRCCALSRISPWRLATLPGRPCSRWRPGWSSSATCRP
ncbi:MAG: alginate export family protein [Candidatus Lindowbacteria bacterium]|nr:alginate export family protein [Candidatus Lindowbacteria bacterium]